MWSSLHLRKIKADARLAKKTLYFDQSATKWEVETESVAEVGKIGEKLIIHFFPPHNCSQKLLCGTTKPKFFQCIIQILWTQRIN